MCGIIGAVGYRPVTLDILNAAHAINRRGEDASGFIGFNTEQRSLDEAIKTKGLVQELVMKTDVAGRDYRSGLCQVRYPTSGSTLVEHAIRDAQPLRHPDIELAAAHNGQIHNLADLTASFGPESYKTSSDVEHLMLALGQEFQSRDYDNDRSDLDFFKEVILPSVDAVYDNVQGAYAALFMTRKGLLAFKDPNGVKPLCYGIRQEDGNDSRIHMFASESHALHSIGGFQGIREIYGGQVTFVSFDGNVFNRRIRNEPQTPCGFEPAYFMEASSDWCGEKVRHIRERLGHVMSAKWPEYQHRLDRIMAVPHSPIPAAQAMAYDWHLMKGGLIALRRGRSFLQPTTLDRRNAAREKFFCEKSAHDGRRIGDIEDSVVRGNTMKELVRMQREVGAAEVHVFSYWPLFAHGCPNGIDVVDRNELLAVRESMDARRMADFLGADSFQALSVDDLVQKGLRQPINQLCVGCTSGQYPNDQGRLTQYFDMRRASRKRGSIS